MDTILLHINCKTHNFYHLGHDDSNKSDVWYGWMAFYLNLLKFPDYEVIYNHSNYFPDMHQTISNGWFFHSSTRFPWKCVMEKHSNIDMQLCMQSARVQTFRLSDFPIYLIMRIQTFSFQTFSFQTFRPLP